VTVSDADSRTRIVFLGGLGEIGRNCACIEVRGRILILDCGLLFPDVDMPGVDLVLPDFTYLRDNADRVEAAVVTHGHEDHIGALPFLLRELSFPIYGSALALNLARGRIEEAGMLDRTRLIPVRDGERRKIGPFDVEFIPVTHSVPHGFATAYRTPGGVILHSGDFKIDLTPVDGRRTDLGRIGNIAESEGVRLLLSDSTNAEEPGFTRSERDVGQVLRDIVRDHPGQRIIVGCFASHLHRIQQVIDAAVTNGRVVATLGRSMGRNVDIAREMAVLEVPGGAIIDIAEAKNVDPGRLLVLSTGSQGEPMSALALMAAGESRWLDVGGGDVVILSSHAIPGNETSVGKVIDGLTRRGVKVIHSGLAQVHSTGHAKQGELKTLLSIVRPEYFIPVHGEYRHLRHHADLAVTMGVSADNVLLCEDGDVVELTPQGTVEFAGQVPAGYLYVDGIVGDIGHGVLRDRRALAEEGVVVVVVTVDAKTGEVLSGPEIITRGWIHAPDAEPLLAEGRAAVLEALEKAAAEGGHDFDTIRRKVRSALGKFVHERTRRRPMIVPVVMEV
jgi:ribonuclease J